MTAPPSSSSGSPIHRFTLVDHLVWLDTQSDAVSLLNPVAARLADLQARGLGQMEMVQDLASRYDAPQALLEEDVARWLGSSVKGMAGMASTVNFQAPASYEPTISALPARPLAVRAALEYHLPGFDIQIRSESVDVVERLRALCRLSAGQAPHRHRFEVDIYANGAIALDGASSDTGQGPADTALKCHRSILRACYQSLPDTLVLHAAGVALGDSAVLLPAGGGSGKTTLTARLIQRGYTLFNDDVVPLEVASGRLVPLPGCLSIKSGSWPVLEPWYPELRGAEVYGNASLRIKYLAPVDAQVCRQPVPCRAIVAPRYVPDARRTDVEELSPALMLQNLLGNGAGIERPIQPAILGAFVAWLANTPCYQLRFSRLEEACEQLDRLMR